VFLSYKFIDLFVGNRLSMTWQLHELTKILETVALTGLDFPK